MRKLIETGFPLENVNVSSMGEKMIKNHPGNLHLWWNRTPVNSTAALLFAALADAPENPEEKGKLDRIITGLAAGDEEVFAQAREQLAGGRNPVITDSFCGYGGIPLAALKLGLTAEAGDLNSVAVLLTKAATEIPSRFAGCRAVHPGSRLDLKPGMSALAEDVNYYGDRLEQMAKGQLTELYPKFEGENVYAWIWVRTTECPNPACRCRVPLASSLVLSKKKGREAWAEPVLENGRIVFRIHSGSCPAGKESNKLKERGCAFRCPACGSLVSEEYIRQQGNTGKLGLQLLAVVTRAGNEKKYWEPEEDQETDMDLFSMEDCPDGEISRNGHWFSPPGYGLTEYRDLYTPRQLRMLCTFCDLIPRVQVEAETDAGNAGMTDDGIPLEEGGSGALAYGQAIGVYLSLVISRMANRHSTICTWDSAGERERAALTRQMIPMTWTFVEMNPFSEGMGSFQSMLSAVKDSIPELPGQGKIHVTQGNALDMEIPEGSIFCGELPYYDSTAYADLSDYFYIWLRRCLKDTYPKLFEEPETSKEELCSIPDHYGKDSNLAKKEYRRQVREFCRKLSGEISVEYPSLVFFKYTEEDKVALQSEGEEEPCALESMLDSLLQAGLQITGLCPVQTGDPAKRQGSTRILIVFRKPGQRLPIITRRTWINTMKKKLSGRLDELACSGVRPENGRVCALGIGISIFTEYERVANADGTDMTIHDALQLIYQESEVYWSSREEEPAAAKEEEEYGGEQQAGKP